MKMPKQLETIPQSFAVRDFRNEPVGNYNINTWQKYFDDDQDFNNVKQQYPSPLV